MFTAIDLKSGYWQILVEKDNSTNDSYLLVLIEDTIILIYHILSIDMIAFEYVQ